MFDNKVVVIRIGKDCDCNPGSFENLISKIDFNNGDRLSIDYSALINSTDNKKTFKTVERNLQHSIVKIFNGKMMLVFDNMPFCLTYEYCECDDNESDGSDDGDDSSTNELMLDFIRDSIITSLKALLSALSTVAEYYCTHCSDDNESDDDTTEDDENDIDDSAINKFINDQVNVLSDEDCECEETTNNTDCCNESSTKNVFAGGGERESKLGKGNFAIIPQRVLSEILTELDTANIMAYENHTIIAINNIVNDKPISAICRLIYDLAHVRDNAYEYVEKTLAFTLLRLSKHFQEGAIKYGLNNWKRGIPAASFKDSAIRHITQYITAHPDSKEKELHYVSAIWNLVCLRQHQIDMYDAETGRTMPI